MEPQQSSPDEPSNETPPHRNKSESWAFPVLLMVLLLALVGLAKWAENLQAPPAPSVAAATWTPAPQPTGQTVRLTIDFGNGAKKEFAALPWQSDMTVADLLVAARQFRPNITFMQLGEGERGFLSSLDGLSNEGAGGRNWLYRVNGKHAHASFCVEKIEPGAHILWTFTDELYNSEPE